MPTLPLPAGSSPTGHSVLDGLGAVVGVGAPRWWSGVSPAPVSDSCQPSVPTGPLGPAPRLPRLPGTGWAHGPPALGLPGRLGQFLSHLLQSLSWCVLGEDPSDQSAGAALGEQSDSQDAVGQVQGGLEGRNGLTTAGLGAAACLRADVLSEKPGAHGQCPMGDALLGAFSRVRLWKGNKCGFFP